MVPFFPHSLSCHHHPFSRRLNSSRSLSVPRPLSTPFHVEDVSHNSSFLHLCALFAIVDFSNRSRRPWMLVFKIVTNRRISIRDRGIVLNHVSRFILPFFRLVLYRQIWFCERTNNNSRRLRELLSLSDGSWVMILKVCMSLDLQLDLWISYRHWWVLPLTVNYWFALLFRKVPSLYVRELLFGFNDQALILLSFHHFKVCSFPFWNR